MSAHTLGPWECYRDDRRELYEVGHRRVTLGTRVVAEVQFGFDEPAESEQHANACLIAAAPDLLALAKQYASECLHCNYGDGATGKGSEGEPCEECADIRAVIAKAEGQS